MLTLSVCRLERSGAVRVSLPLVFAVLSVAEQLLYLLRDSLCLLHDLLLRRQLSSALKRRRRLGGCRRSGRTSTVPRALQLRLSVFRRRVDRRIDVSVGRVVVIRIHRVGLSCKT